MPSLHLQLTAEGPVVDVLVGVSQPRAQALRAAGHAVPPPIQARLLVDTGASATCFEAGHLAPLGLSPTGQIAVSTPSTGNSPVTCAQYDVSLTLLHPGVGLNLPATPILECGPLGGLIHGLLGRDILAHCVLVYHGPIDQFSLSF